MKTKNKQPKSTTYLCTICGGEWYKYHDAVKCCNGGAIEKRFAGVRLK